MALKASPQHGYSGWTALVCDTCGKTISEGENPERALDTSPSKTITIRRSIITRQGIKRESFDYCDVKCQFMHGIYTTEETGEAQS